MLNNKYDPPFSKSGVSNVFSSINKHWFLFFFFPPHVPSCLFLVLPFLRTNIILRFWHSQMNPKMIFLEVRWLLNFFFLRWTTRMSPLHALFIYLFIFLVISLSRVLHKLKIGFFFFVFLLVDPPLNLTQSTLNLNENRLVSWKFQNKNISNVMRRSVIIEILHAFGLLRHFRYVRTDLFSSNGARVLVWHLRLCNSVSVLSVCSEPWQSWQASIWKVYIVSQQQ